MRPERRRHERIRIRAEARLQDGGKEAHLHARDLSLGGAFVAVEPGDGDGLDFAEGVVVDLLLCPDEEGPHHAVVDGASLHASARIVRALGTSEDTIQRLVRGDARTVSPQLRDMVIDLYDA